jgi:hypothetical protein
MFSYADRNRVNPDRHQIPLAPGNGGRSGTILIDGTYQGDWQIRVSGDDATLLIKPLGAIADSDAQALTDEGAGLLAFAADAAGTRRVRFLGPGTGTSPSRL